VESGVVCILGLWWRGVRVVRGGRVGETLLEGLLEGLLKGGVSLLGEDLLLLPLEPLYLLYHVLGQLDLCFYHVLLPHVLLIEPLHL